jgi:ubiquinone/menaquinone biosynthesis C-methylase UbiE
LKQPGTDTTQVKNEWDVHWHKMEKRTLFGSFVEWYRKNLIASEIAFFTSSHFSSSGIFVECGSGTSQTSWRMEKEKRIFICTDISYKVLLKARQAPVIDACLNCDIFHLPLKDESLDGIWNAGVMEHFGKEDIHRLLYEFSRVLKKNRVAVLFWPAFFGPSNLIFTAIERIAKIFLRRTVDFFPDECSLIHSRKEAQKMLEGTGMEISQITWSWRSGFIHYVIILKK